MSVQVIMLSLQNIFTFSYGIFSIQSLQIGKLKAMLGYFKMPVLCVSVSINFYIMIFLFLNLCGRLLTM